MISCQDIRGPMAREIPVGGWRPVRGSPSVMVKMFSAAAASPGPPPPSLTPFPYPLPPSPPTPPLQEPSCAIWPFGAAGPRGPRRSAGAAGPGPVRADRALGVRNRHTFAESPCFIQSTESGAEMGPVIQNGPTMERQTEVTVEKRGHRDGESSFNFIQT